MGILESVCKDIIPKRRTCSKRGNTTGKEEIAKQIENAEEAEIHCTWKMQEKRDRKENIGDRIDYNRAQEKLKKAKREKSLRKYGQGPKDIL